MTVNGGTGVIDGCAVIEDVGICVRVAVALACGDADTVAVAFGVLVSADGVAVIVAEGMAVEVNIGVFVVGIDVGDMVTEGMGVDVEVG